MKLIKQDKGHTLIEIILVSGLIGMVMLLLWTNYLSVHRTYIKAGKKAQNLEEARTVINLITDNFQKYESRECEIIITDTGLKLENGQTGTVKSITFKDPTDIDPTNPVEREDMVIAYDHTTVMFGTKEIGTEITNFTVTQKDDLLDFSITATQKGNGVVQDQIIELGTTVSLQYTKKPPILP